MGTPIPLPIVPPVVGPGGSCLNCWGPGKPFGDVSTPNMIIANFSGITYLPGNPGPSNEPLKGPFELLQLGGIGCFYILQTEYWFIGIVFRSDETSVLVRDDLFDVQFDSLIETPCLTFLENQATGQWQGGSCSITIPVV
jgi:hypothetical protein